MTGPLTYFLSNFGSRNSPVLKFEFYKYHGTGNDFILVDARDNDVFPGEDAIERLCHRRFGIGADGLILLTREPGFHFRMVYYNSDGRESTMCGNGGRCAVAFHDFLSPADEKVRFMAIDGDHSAVILKREGNLHHIRLQMGDTGKVGRWKEDFLLDTGSPHLVRFAADTAGMDVARTGRTLRNHEDFQTEGINVNFVSVEPDGLLVRTYERGVEDETLSCGTGVTAAALIHAWKEKMADGRLKVQTRGGQLEVHFRQHPEGFSDVWLEGPAVRVFQGIINL